MQISQNFQDRKCLSITVAFFTVSLLIMGTYELQAQPDSNVVIEKGKMMVLFKKSFEDAFKRYMRNHGDTAQHMRYLKNLLENRHITASSSLGSSENSPFYRFARLRFDTSYDVMERVNAIRSTGLVSAASSIAKVKGGLLGEQYITKRPSLPEPGERHSSMLGCFEYHNSASYLNDPCFHDAW